MSQEGNWHFITNHLIIYSVIHHRIPWWIVPVSFRAICEQIQQECIPVGCIPSAAVAICLRGAASVHAGIPPLPRPGPPWAWVWRPLLARPLNLPLGMGIYYWGICTTCRYRFYCVMLKPYALRLPTAATMCTVSLLLLFSCCCSSALSRTVLCGALYTACVDASRTVFWDHSVLR